ncbi:Response regulator of zinc sigma-54-dependent two-component system [Labilithrix luteola]|uniref:Response regulator of zinc sigma-54-dependent two-component system n=1 Tax=Labilithrix luteola TaxID=1391654 RepID=A0A0K1PJI0_9BACT|nr:sigma-54 dependent transcriptional regulator [Labilithrix luteola]AKU93677.1 Response regulator of zinc sigma-54-dependent two-component system [Labilithrix luteola]
MKRLLLTWSDRGVEGPAPAHQAKRPASDRGPVLRLLEDPTSTHRYDRALVLTVPKGLRPAEALAHDMKRHVGEVDVRAVSLDDPSDYAALFRQLAPLASEIEGTCPPSKWNVDVLLSAGTPQAQTIWVILAQAAILRARLLQVIPAAFVPSPHPRAVREVSFDIEGFPEIRVLREEVSRLRAEVRARGSRIVAESDPMRELMARVVRVARSELPVLVQGETGVGKELVARAIHDGSPRAAGPFVAENCGALAESVLASELFGHEASAFTGAGARHRGLFEQAHGGTIFLDEVGELPVQVQIMLLRVLQEGTLRRVGGEKPVRVDVRVVAATHRDLTKMVARGTFREDLYYRLHGATLRVPPLRERVSDIPSMVKAFLQEAFVGRRGRALTVTPAAMRRLASHSWPGNVRELRSEVQRWTVFCDDAVDVEDLAPEILEGKPAAPRPSGRQSEQASAPVQPLRAAVDEAERSAIEHALRACSGNLLQTSKALGVERNTLKRKLYAFGLYPGEASAVGSQRRRRR